MGRQAPAQPGIHSARHRAARGHTLVELITTLGIMSLVFAGVGSAMVIGSRALDAEAGTDTDSARARKIADRMTADLSVALSITEQTATAITFTVPDRDGNLAPETIRYAWSGTAGDPLTREYNGGTAVTIADDVQNLNLSYLLRTMIPKPQACCNPNGSCVDDRPDYCTDNGGTPQGRDTVCATTDCPAPPIHVLLVVRDATNPIAMDQARQSLIESWEFTVALIAAAESQAAFDTALTDADVAYVTELGTDAMNDLGSKLNATSKGVITEEGRKVYKMGGFGLTPWFSSDTIRITSTAHYITSPLTTGERSIATAVQNLWYLVPTYAIELVVLADDVAGSRPVLACVDAGKLLNDNTPAPGRRVKLPWGMFDYDITLLNADGLTIMQRAIEWAAGRDDAGAPSQCGDTICDGGETPCTCPVDCGGYPASEVAGATCADGYDNDCDTATDCADVDCAGDPSCIECGNGICQPGEDCNSCGQDCESKTSGPPSGRYCCGNGILEEAEGDGSICDGNP